MTHQSKTEGVKDFKKILERLRYWKDQDQRINKGLEALTKEIAPNSYAPYCEISCVGAYIEHFELSLRELFEWWIWEAPTMKHATLQRDGKEWNANEENQFLDYLNTYHQ